MSKTKSRAKKKIKTLNQLDKLALAILERCQQKDWGHLTAEYLAKKSQLSLTFVQNHIHDELSSYLFLIRYLDEKQETIFQKNPLTGSVSDIFFEIIMTRIELLESHRDAYQTLSRHLLEKPRLKLQIAFRLSQSFDKIISLYAPSMQNRDERFLSLRLFIIYAFTGLAWQFGTKNNLGKTMAVLNRCLMIDHELSTHLFTKVMRNKKK